MTLADRLVHGPLPLEDASSIARQIAEALEAAHDHGIVHRDLKPANIKLRADGTVKVLDFGLAKAFDPTATASDASQLPTLTSPAATRIGVIMGTAAYMSPEQARGKTVDKRADVWAFGCVLYEMLAGTRPFEGDDVSETMARVIEREPDWSALLERGAAVRRSQSSDAVCRRTSSNRLRDIGDARLELRRRAGRPRRRRRRRRRPTRFGASGDRVDGRDPRCRNPARASSDARWLPDPRTGRRPRREPHRWSARVAPKSTFRTMRRSPWIPRPRTSGTTPRLLDISPDGRTLVYVGSREWDRSALRAAARYVRGPAAGRHRRRAASVLLAGRSIGRLSDERQGQRRIR